MIRILQKTPLRSPAPDHSPSIWSSDNTIPLVWSGATDGNGSGAAGYSILWSTSPISLPDTTVDLTNTIATSLPLTDGSSWYFHLRTQDQVNLWASSALDSGPFFIDTLPPSSSITQVAVQPCGLSFTLEWSGEDSGSGLASFDLQYRVDTNGAWTDWLQATTLSKSTFGPFSPFGPATETPVYLRVRARDKAGNIELYPSGDGDAWFVPQSTCLVFMPLTAK